MKCTRKVLIKDSFSEYEIEFPDIQTAIAASNERFLASSEACIMETIIYEGGKRFKITFRNRKRRIIYQLKTYRLIQEKLF